MFQVAGFSFIGQGENVGILFIRMKDWSDRKTKAADFVGWANGMAFMTVKNAQVFFANLPTISGLGQFGGFDFYLEDRSGTGSRGAARRAGSADAEGLAEQDPGQRAPEFSRAGAAARLTLDRVQAQSMGLPIRTCSQPIRLMLAPVYVNDFYFEGRVLRVLMQADAPFRSVLIRCRHFYLPSTMPQRVPRAPTPDGAECRAHQTSPNADHGSALHGGQFGLDRRLAESVALQRLRGGGDHRQNAPGKSSGEAMKEMERIVAEDLPHRIRLRLGRPVFAGNPLGRGGAAPLRPLDPRGIPVPRRAL